jgi:hypothetical protein
LEFLGSYDRTFGAGKTLYTKGIGRFRKNQFYEKNNLKVLEEILSVFKPTELAVTEFSKESSNLLTCEGVFKFLFDFLAKQGSELSEMMLEALRKRYNERRNKDLVSFLKYLQNPNMIQSKQTTNLIWQ